MGILNETCLMKGHLSVTLLSPPPPRTGPREAEIKIFQEIIEMARFWKVYFPCTKVSSFTIFLMHHYNPLYTLNNIGFCNIFKTIIQFYILCRVVFGGGWKLDANWHVFSFSNKSFLFFNSTIKSPNFFPAARSDANEILITYNRWRWGGVIF